MKHKKIALIILDGWGYGKRDQSDAIYTANTPVFDQLIKDHPNSKLHTHGEHVGLPDGQMGNSEVGHLNIGAGRVVFQDLVKINRSIASGEFANNKVLLHQLQEAKAKQKNVHLLGLVSDGGIHSHQKHLQAILDVCQQQELPNVFVHAFTDGRDTDPRSGLGFLKGLQSKLDGSKAKLVSVIGRYYAMDRDQRWERIKKAYDLIIHGVGARSINILESVERSYQNDITDEFIEPICLSNEDGHAVGRIEEGDTVIFFNYRTDRCRQLCRALSQEAFNDFSMKPISIDLLTMTTYDENFEDIGVLFEKDNLKNTLGELVSKAGKSQVRIAETEKYPHVTYFFSGGRESEFDGEKRIMVPSPKVATYDLQPAMSAESVTENILREIDEYHPDFICLNFANPDMVGHTGVFPAIKKAVETVDACLGKIVEKATAEGYGLLVIADHGNADCAVNPDGSPNTAHTINPVPIILIGSDYPNLNDGKLADVAPTILKLMGIEKTSEMQGKVLV